MITGKEICIQKSKSIRRRGECCVDIGKEVNKTQKSSGMEKRWMWTNSPKSNVPIVSNQLFHIQFDFTFQYMYSRRPVIIYPVDN